jgi:hypothetical protein
VTAGDDDRGHPTGDVSPVVEASSNATTLPSSSGNRDWSVFALIALMTAGTISGLWAFARDSPSAGSNNPRELPVPSISAADACTNFARYWMQESGVNVDASVIEGLTNCWPAADGSWFVPDGISDSRLPVDFALSESEKREAEPIRDELLAEIGELELALSSSMTDDLARIYESRIKAISGHVREPTPIGRPRSRYTRVMQAFLIAPEHALLADYSAWLMGAKIRAYETLRNQCVNDPATRYLQDVCRGLEDSLSVWFPPWIWDLRDPVAMNSFILHLLRDQ